MSFTKKILFLESLKNETFISVNASTLFHPKLNKQCPYLPEAV